MGECFPQQGTCPYKLSLCAQFVGGLVKVKVPEPMELLSCQIKLLKKQLNQKVKKGGVGETNVPNHNNLRILCLGVTHEANLFLLK